MFYYIGVIECIAGRRSTSRTHISPARSGARGTIEKAMQLAAHELPRTTKLYDRTQGEVSQGEVSQDEVERIRF